MSTGSSRTIDHDDVNVVVYLQRGQKYVFYFDAELSSWHALYRVLGQFAADPDLDFTWVDAVRVIWIARRSIRST